MTLWNYIKDKMMTHPLQTISEGKSTLSYEEVVIFAERFAERLSGERCAAILCGSEMASAIAMLSCFAAGVTGVPMSIRYGEVHCKRIFETVTPTVLITDAEGGLNVIYLEDDKYKEPAIHPAVIMCTSGTTGVPKGVMLSEENLLTNVKDICSYFKITSKDTMLIARPIYHCAVLSGELLTSLVKGLKIVFYSGNLNVQSIVKIIENEKITVLCSTPTFFSLFSRFLNNHDISSLKTICVSGECMKSDLGYRLARQLPNIRIYHVYGLTEASPRVSYLSPELFEEHPGSVGVPLPSVRIKIVNGDGKVAKVGEAGVLWVKGKNVMFGYYNSNRKTKKALVNGWLCTGDIAYIDELGLLYIKGRNDDLIIRAGMNIYPTEIESELLKDPRVKEVLVYGRKLGTEGEQVGMKIVGDFSDVAEVKQLCIKKLPSYSVPTYVEIVESIPKNGSGKILRQKKYA